MNAPSSWQRSGDRRRRAGSRHRAGSFLKRGLRIEARRVVHTNHPAYGYRIRAAGHTVVWAPEFYRFPRWVRRTDLMFAEASAWDRPIRFAGGVGGYADVLTIAEAARRRGVKRLGFALIGRPTLRALARGVTPPFGEFAVDGQVFVIRRKALRGSSHGTEVASVHGRRTRRGHAETESAEGKSWAAIR